MKYLKNKFFLNQLVTEATLTGLVLEPEGYVALDDLQV
jgi:hypothetical protein